jgi:hypothetical protein
MLKASAALIMGRRTPILLGGGKTVFDGIKKRYPLAPVPHSVSRAFPA